MATLSFNSNITGGTLTVLDGTLTITPNTAPAPPTLTYTLTNGTVCPVSGITIGASSASFKITYNGNLYTFSGTKSGKNYSGSVNGPSITGEQDNWTATATNADEEIDAKQAGYSAGS